MTTPNRNYNEPEAGETDWHIPVNENWNDIDADVQGAIDGDSDAVVTTTEEGGIEMVVDGADGEGILNIQTGEQAAETSLLQAIGDGEVAADDGNIYTTVQDAADAATDWVFVGNGTFAESVDITTTGLTIEGTGRGSFIQSTGSGPAIDAATDVTVKNVRVETSGTTDNADAINTGTNLEVRGVYISGSDSGGVRVDHSRVDVINCEIENTSSFGVGVQGGNNSFVVNNYLTGTSDGLATWSDNHTFSQNWIVDPGGKGIRVEDANMVVTENQIRDAGGNGIDVYGAANGSIITTNRIFGSVGSDLNDRGGHSNTIIDNNVTGT